MAGPFNVESGVPGTQVWNVDAAGNTTQSGTLSSTTAIISTLTTLAGTINGITAYGLGGGVNSSIEAGGTVLSTLLIAPQEVTGTQIGDITRDYMCYVICTAGGTNNTLTIGSASGGTSATIFAAATMAAGTSASFRLPAGWRIFFNGTGTFGTQFGVPC